MFAGQCLRDNDLRDNDLRDNDLRDDDLRIKISAAAATIIP
jgi:hypothetical protein